MNKNGNGKCEIKKLDHEQHTFGANIHELLYDSFFLKSTTGEFANEKITNLIEWLKNDADDSKNINEGSKAYYMQILDYIDEPVLKNKLRSMWIEKIGNNPETKKLWLKKQIAKLQNELDNL